MNLEEAARHVQLFAKGSLTGTLAELEAALAGRTRGDTANFTLSSESGDALIESVALLKTFAAQIHMVVHAAGILSSLREILLDSETIEYVSLGAGNTGRAFDLSTSHRVAEFKFINWRGGPESIRQNSLFKDFYELAEFETPKRRYLYVLGLEFPTRFFNGGRSIDSVTSRNIKLSAAFHKKYGNGLAKVRDYYELKKNVVEIQDLTQIVPSLSRLSGHSEWRMG